MNNKRKSKVVETFMEEEKCKIFGKFESMTKKKGHQKFGGGWEENFRCKSQTEKCRFGKWNFPWEPKNPPSQIPAYATDENRCLWILPASYGTIGRCRSIKQIFEQI